MFLSLVIGRIKYYLRCKYSKKNNNLKRILLFFILIHNKLTNKYINVSSTKIMVVNQHVSNSPSKRLPHPVFLTYNYREPLASMLQSKF